MPGNFYNVSLRYNVKKLVVFKLFIVFLKRMEWLNYEKSAFSRVLFFVIVYALKCIKWILKLENCVIFG